MAHAHRPFARCVPAAVLLILAPLVADPARGQTRGPAPTPAAPAPLRVTSARVESRSVAQRVATAGTLRASAEAVARAHRAGTVLRLDVDLGDPVRAGQPLAELDRRDDDLAIAELVADAAAARESLARARAAADASRAALDGARERGRTLAADVERARADAEWKRREHERYQDLLAKELVAARDVDQTRAQVQAAEALVATAETALAHHGDQLRAAEAQLAADQAAVTAADAGLRQREAALELAQARASATVVPAPLTGVVAKRHVAVGERVQGDAPLITVVATDPLTYTGTVAERAAPAIRPGQEVRLSVAAHGARTFPGEVTRVAPVVDTPTRTLALEARVPNAEGLLRPGFRARGTVEVRRDGRARVVPAEALAVTDGGSQVFVLAEGRAEARPVRTGPRTAGWVEILDGVRPGEVVATSGLAQLYDGAPVTLAPAPRAGVPGTP
jgi:RND family efflux transporter MFP subunit